MAKTFTAPFAQDNKTNAVTVTDTTETLIATAGAEGSILTKVSAIPEGTVTASKLRILLSKDSGATKLTIDTALLGAYTASTTTASPKIQFEDISEATPIRLEAGDELYVVCDVAQAAGVTFKAEWSDM